MLQKLFKNPLHVAITLKILILDRFQRYREIFWALRDAGSVREEERVLFVDLGANIGQGFKWFSRYFCQSNVKFELFEPNPYCFKMLQELPLVQRGEVIVFNVAVGLLSGKLKFYGLSDEELGKYSEGGSLLKEHNAIFYRARERSAIDVNVVNFNEYLKEKIKSFERIIVKMDIEGGEVELLESLIENGTINLIDTLYVEFHSKYRSKIDRHSIQARELKIIRNIKGGTNVRLRIWH